MSAVQARASRRREVALELMVDQLESQRLEARDSAAAAILSRQRELIQLR